jgi:hypothetical protein
MKGLRICFFPTQQNQPGWRRGRTKGKVKWRERRQEVGREELFLTEER